MRGARVLSNECEKTHHLHAAPSMRRGLLPNTEVLSTEGSPVAVFTGDTSLRALGLTQ